MSDHNTRQLMRALSEIDDLRFKLGNMMNHCACTFHRDPTTDELLPTIVDPCAYHGNQQCKIECLTAENARLLEDADYYGKRWREHNLTILTDQHDSDCATYNMPAYPNGPCDCSLQEQK